jgi:hypothetical protein
MADLLVDRMIRLRDRLSPLNEKFGVPQYQQVILVLKAITPAQNPNVPPSQRAKLIPGSTAATSMKLIVPAPKVESVSGTYRDADYFYNSDIKIIQQGLKISKITRELGVALESNAIDAVYVGSKLMLTVGAAEHGLQDVTAINGAYKAYTVHTLDQSETLTYTIIAIPKTDKSRRA